MNKTKKIFYLFIFLLLSIFIFSQDKKSIKFKNAELIDSETLRVQFSGLPQNIEVEDIQIKIEPEFKILSKVRKGQNVDIKVEGKFVIDKTYNVSFYIPSTNDKDTIQINTSFLFQEYLNTIYSDKELGYFYKDGKSIFRYFAPRAKKVKLVIFEKYDDKTGKEYDMVNDGNQVFEYTINGELWGKYYGYKITERSYSPGKVEPLIDPDIVIADPYSKAIAQSNVFPQKGRTLIYDTSKFDWQGTKPTGLDISEAIIMEMHIRDLTAHNSAGSKYPGTYKGAIDATVGGLNYLKKLGVNAIELLPVHEFCNIEPPFKQKTPYYTTNTWNTYAQNYWGYMTSSYFAPESYYATDGTLDPTKWNGTKGLQVDELKELIRECHKNGIAVILDVVYNHVSQYDENPLKYTDYEYYFRKVPKTGCGNEVESRRPMVRRMILDSLKYWMTEYHIDGFRFDLATSHDPETLRVIKEELPKINPKVMIIAEPWGGDNSSNKNDLQRLGWSYWNDGIRGAIRGENRPVKEGKSFILGNNDKASSLKDYLKGTSQGESWQSVNYIESHDDATLGDIIRVMSGEYTYFDKDNKPNRITDIKKYLKFSQRLLSASKVGAVALFLCPGPIMLHLGQEWGRGKVTPDLTGKIEEIITKDLGKSSDDVAFLVPTPNSYSADNETNYINYEYISLNQELFDYYKGLIELRKSEPLFTYAKPEQIEIIEDKKNLNSIGTIIDKKIIGIVNSDPKLKANYKIPPGNYKLVVDENKAGVNEIKTIKGGNITINPASSIILIKK